MNVNRDIYLQRLIDHRGIGLIQGLEFKEVPKAIVDKALEKGLVLIAAGNNTIRFVPPLIINKSDIDVLINILSTIIK